MLDTWSYSLNNPCGHPAPTAQASVAVVIYIRQTGHGIATKPLCGADKQAQATCYL